MNNFWTTFNDGHGPDLEVGKLRREGPWHAIEVCLKAKARYKPGISRLTCQVIIIAGKGAVQVGDQTILYTPGTVIDVPEGTLHGFTLAKTQTIFTKRWQPTAEDIARIERFVETIEHRVSNRSRNIHTLYDQ